MAKTALIIGATGLVGEQCLMALLHSDSYSSVVVLTRHPLAVEHARFKNIVVDFEQIDNYAAQIKCDDVFCTVGTTIAKAGSKGAFKKVDYDIPYRVAEIAKNNGASKYVLVSSLGADAGSSIFYSKIKGQLEEALKKLNYSLLVIFRPSILLGNRKEKRTGEAIGMFVAEKLPFIFAGPLKKYKGTPVDMLGAAMVKAAQAPKKGVWIVENEEIFTL